MIASEISVNFEYPGGLRFGEIRSLREGCVMAVCWGLKSSHKHAYLVVEKSAEFSDFFRPDREKQLDFYSFPKIANTCSQAEKIVEWLYTLHIITALII